MAKVERWQAEKIKKAIRPTLRYLTLMREQMERKGFAPADKLFQLVCQARDAMQDLSVELHYLSCQGGRREAGGVGA
jgi:hypothetical protein